MGGVRFDDFGRRKLVARGSRYAPMPSASFGEFNRIAVRIMSSHSGAWSSAATTTGEVSLDPIRWGHIPH